MLALDSPIDSTGQVKPEHQSLTDEVGAIGNLLKVLYGLDLKTGQPYLQQNFERDFVPSAFNSRSSWSALPLETQRFYFISEIDYWLNFFDSGEPLTPSKATSLSIAQEPVEWSLLNLSSTARDLSSSVISAAKDAVAKMTDAFGIIGQYLREGVFKSEYREPLREYALDMKVFGEYVTSSLESFLSLQEHCYNILGQMDMRRIEFVSRAGMASAMTIHKLTEELKKLRESESLIGKMISDAKNAALSAAKLAAEIAEGALDAARETIDQINKSKWWILAGAALLFGGLVYLKFR